jgi:hypothetical protein
LETAGQRFGLISRYGRAHYRLPTYSEDLITYELSPYVKGDINPYFPLSYAISLGYSGKEYPLTPMKSYTRYHVYGGASFDFSTSYVLHHLKVEGGLDRYNYIGLTTGENVPVGVKEKSLFEYVPTIMSIFKVVMSVNRTLSVYSGTLKDRSQVYRSILLEGNMDAGNTEVYLRRRREDHVFLHKSRSSDTRTLLRYVLGVSQTYTPVRFTCEISAIYTLYRFKGADNSLYRYFDSEVSYEGRSEFNLRVRIWDRGRYVEDSAVYYRLIRGVDVYSGGWVPVVSIGDVDVGMAYNMKPEGRAVGIKTKFPGGEVSAMRRYENDHFFWQVSLRFSKTF